MSDDVVEPVDNETVNEVDPVSPDADEGTEVAEFEPITSQEQFDKLIGRRIGEAQRKAEAKYEGYDDLKAKAEQLDALLAEKKEAEQASMSDLEKLQAQLDEATAGISERDERIASFEKQVAEFEVSQLRAKVAADKGLPSVLAARLTGSTEDEIVADAEELLKAFPAPIGGRPQADNLRGGGAAGDSDDAELTPAQIADRLGSLNGMRAL